MELKFQIQIKIKKPITKVFDAVYDPKKLSSYFTSGGAEGKLDTGKEVIWKFRDNKHNKAMCVPVKVQKMIPNEFIQFSWAASEGTYDAKTGKMPHPGGYKNTVEFHFESLGKSETLVKITEGSWQSTQDGLQGSYLNCQGWTHMSCCLKAYMEYGINLRKGSF